MDRTPHLIRRWRWWLAVLLLPMWLSGPGAESQTPAVEDGSIDVVEPIDVDGFETEAQDPSDPTQGADPTSRPSLTEALGDGAVVAIVRLEGMIYDFTLESIKRRVDRARRDHGAEVIVLELKTPGGVLTSALALSKYLKSIDELTVAWINDEAYSAGILVASACDEIIMARHSATGDCAPIAMGASLGPREVKKALGPLLAEFRDNARTHGYPFVLFQAMCVEGVKVFRVRHKQTGRIRYVNERDYRYMVHGVSSLAPSTAADSESALQQDVLSEYVVQSVTAATESGAWELDEAPDKSSPLVYDGTTFYTVTDAEAKELGLARAIVNDQTQLKKYLRASKVVRINPTWSEGFAGWLTHPMVRGVLMLAVLVGAYMEFQAPGFGVPGTVAAIALIALLGAPYIVGLAEVWHALLFLLGVVLLAIELFVTPGFGLLGLLGMGSILAGTVLSIVPASGPLRLPAPEVYDRLAQSALWTLLGVLGSFVGFYFVTKHFGRIPGLNRLILATAGGPASVQQIISGSESIGAGGVEIGAEGEVVSFLRPVGQALIDGKTVDVISEGDWIEVGRRVRVSQVHGNRIVVEEARAS